LLSVPLRRRFEYLVYHQNQWFGTNVLLVLQARHGQLNAMGWFGNIGIASPAGPSDLHSNPDAMLNSEHLHHFFQWLLIMC